MYLLIVSFMKILRARQPDNVWIILHYARAMHVRPAENSRCEVCTDMNNTNNYIGYYIKLRIDKVILSPTL